MEGAGGAWCEGAVLRFRYADPHHRLAGVRLWSSAIKADLAFRADLGAWELRCERPPVRRLDYHFELTGPAGDRDETGPAELRCPGYQEPDWLTAAPAAGAWRRVRLSGLTARVWSPAAGTDRVLVAHDGPEYAHRGRLADYTASAIGSGRVRPYHLVLLEPGSARDRDYSADPGYARFLALEALPRIRARLGAGPVIGTGVSLGALAMAHAQWRFPESFAGLFLQSGSYFQARLDRQESGFRFFRRIVRFTGLVRRSKNGPGIPVTLTCGAAEENLANNRDMADALRGQGYAVAFAEYPDAHTWTGWRDALHPHLTGLLRRVWT
ncbi:alpha/beta hydrolase [Actinoplanes philippinensis]|uniref:alpha/beta hydrolase n=1 Tax=Actinoplanes philippinensis TaxID=35752 RepID=UPI0033ECC5D8